MQSTSGSEKTNHRALRLWDGHSRSHPKQTRRSRWTLRIASIGHPTSFLPVVVLFLHSSPVHIFLIAPAEDQTEECMRHLSEAFCSKFQICIKLLWTSSPSSSALLLHGVSSILPFAFVSSSSPLGSSGLECWASLPPEGLGSLFSTMQWKFFFNWFWSKRGLEIHKTQKRELEPQKGHFLHFSMVKNRKEQLDRWLL